MAMRKFSFWSFLAIGILAFSSQVGIAQTDSFVNAINNAAPATLPCGLGDNVPVIQGSATKRIPCGMLFGVGTVPQTINLNANALPTKLPGTLLQGGQLDGVASRFELVSFGNSTIFTGRRADGTNAIPTAVQLNDALAALNAWAFDGSVWAGPSAAVQLVAGENWSVGHRGTYIKFSTTPVATTTMTDDWEIGPDGGLFAIGATGGSKGFGSINITGNYYINNQALAVIFGANAPIAFSGNNIALNFANTLRNNGGNLDLNPGPATAALNGCSTTLQGLVPPTGGGTSNFLRADCVFAPAPSAAFTSNGPGIKLAAGVASFLGDPGSITNCTLSASVSGNALTIALLTQAGATPSTSDPCVVSFRDLTAPGGGYTYVTVTAATTFSTGNNGSTFGSLNTVPFRLWVTALNAGGTVVLGVSDQSGPAGIKPLVENTLHNGTACNACTNANVLGTLYTTASQASLPTRILGHMDWGSGLTTAGVWASGPTTIQMMGPGSKKPGDTIQEIYATSSSTTNSSGSAVQTGLSQAITLTAAMNLVEIDARGTLTDIDNAASAVAQISRGTGPTFIGNNPFCFSGSVSGANCPASLLAIDIPGTVSSTTYSVYVSGGGSVANGYRWGQSQTMKVREIMG